jgi:hypothetical protein
MCPRILLGVVLWCAATSIGCGYKRPFERPPGTISQQRIEAYQHDPYADQDAGPEVVGGRPREFSKPDPIAERNRTHPASQYNDRRSWFGNWFGG